MALSVHNAYSYKKKIKKWTTYMVFKIQILELDDN